MHGEIENFDDETAAGSEFQVFDSPQRLLELERMVQAFLNHALKKQVTHFELKVVIALFTLSVDHLNQA